MNFSDSDGNVPMWEAILGSHDTVAKLLLDNGAVLDSGDVAHFACIAAEQNNLNLLKEIARYGGDVTSPKSNGSTALHVAVSEDNIEIVKHLLDQGADIDKPDIHGWTPRALADQQGHEEIQALFQSKDKPKTQSIIAIPEKVRFLGRFTSEPAIRPASQEGSFPGSDGSSGRNRPRRRTNNFHNSLFGIMSAANTGEKDTLFSISMTRSPRDNGTNNNPARVTISCPEKGQLKGMLVLLPDRFQDLLDLGAKKFGFLPTKVVNKEGAEIDNIEVIRDGDHLIFVGGDLNRDGLNTQNCHTEGA